MSLALVSFSVKQHSQVFPGGPVLFCMHASTTKPAVKETSPLTPRVACHPPDQFGPCQFLPRLAVPARLPAVLPLSSTMAETWQRWHARLLYSMKERILFHYSLGEESQDRLLAPSVSESSAKQLHQQALCLRCDFLRGCTR